jgi:hypothetical protein
MAVAMPGPGLNSGIFIVAGPLNGSFVLTDTFAFLISMFQ